MAGSSNATISEQPMVDSTLKASKVNSTETNSESTVVDTVNPHHGLIMIAAELRLKIYEYLLPLHIDSGNLMGLVLSCRLIKAEVYYEMAKKAKTIHDTISNRWPFKEKCNILFPGRLFSENSLVIEVPSLYRSLCAATSLERGHHFERFRGILSFPDIKRLTLRISDPGIITGLDELEFEGDPINIQHVRALRYLYLSAVVDHVTGHIAKWARLEFTDRDLDNVYGLIYSNGMVTKT